MQAICIIIWSLAKKRGLPCGLYDVDCKQLKPLRYRAAARSAQALLLPINNNTDVQLARQNYCKPFADQLCAAKCWQGLSEATPRSVNFDRSRLQKFCWNLLWLLFMHERDDDYAEVRGNQNQQEIRRLLSRVSNASAGNASIKAQSLWEGKRSGECS